MTAQRVADLYLSDVRGRMRGVRALGDGALAQLQASEWHTPLAQDGNSAAVLIQHLAGNMHSRWGRCAAATARAPRARVRGATGTRSSRRAPWTESPS
ncbi:DUF1572 family protein [Deinococcus radiopugnans]|uniref:DUF1572 family protein n=1 Tax=Deinococcus radiopugnans TaxID=57497 RepID=UPI003610BF61